MRRSYHICYINSYTDEYISIIANHLFIDRMIEALEGQWCKVCVFSDNYWRGDDWNEEYLRKQ